MLPCKKEELKEILALRLIKFQSTNPTPLFPVSNLTTL